MLGRTRSQIEPVEKLALATGPSPSSRISYFVVLHLKKISFLCDNTPKCNISSEMALFSYKEKLFIQSSHTVFL